MPAKAGIFGGRAHARQMARGGVETRMEIEWIERANPEWRDLFDDIR
jgi:hypothetical protein